MLFELVTGMAVATSAIACLLVVLPMLERWSGARSDGGAPAGQPAASERSGHGVR
jgi:hypothetical protein